MEPDFKIEIYLQPGEFYWGDSETQIKTLLGSCVAICLWHKSKSIGGMCHSMLPSRKEKAKELSAKYIDEALLLFLKEIENSKTKPSEYLVKIFGGGDMFNKSAKEDFSIGKRNIVEAGMLLHKNGFKITSQDVGGTGHRNLIFNLWNGDAWMRHTKKHNE